MLQGTLLVDMLDGFISSILADVFAWESEPIAVGGLKWHSVVSVVDHWQSKLLEVSHKSSENVSLWHVESTVLVEF